MKRLLLTILSLAGICCFGLGCATRAVCQAVTQEIVLSPGNENSGYRLVSITNSRKVTIRDVQNGEYFSARPGEAFSRESGPPTGLTLLSADPSTGRVVVQDVMFEMSEQ